MMVYYNGFLSSPTGAGFLPEYFHVGNATPQVLFGPRPIEKDMSVQKLIERILEVLAKG